MKQDCKLLEWRIAEDEHKEGEYKGDEHTGEHEGDHAWQTAPGEAQRASDPLYRYELAAAAVIIASLLLLFGSWVAQRSGSAQHAHDPAQQGEIQPQKEDDRQRIPLDPTRMGPLQTLQIAHFTIFYHAVDAGAVYEAAPRLEQLYATLRRDFGLPAAKTPAIQADASYTIEVAGLEVATDRDLGLFASDASKRTIRIPSPATLSAPGHVTATTLLYQAIVYPLARLTLKEGIAAQLGRQPGYIAVSPELDALILWEFWDEGGPLTDGHEDIIRWVYEGGVNAGKARLPAGYESICRAYRTWQITPWEFSIPLTCTRLDSDVVLPWPRPALANHWPQPSLQSVRYSRPKQPYYHTLTMVTIVDYIVAVYGRERLPALATALVENPNPAYLIPTLFDMPVDQFEAGWQAYLARRY